MAEKTQTRRGPLGWVKRHKKLTIFLVIVLVAALVLVNVLGKTDKAAAGSYQFVRTTVLTKTTLSDTVSVTGTVKAGSSASVTASDSVKTYKVTAVNVAVGDTVRKGDVIATLDTTDVEKQIANAQLQLSDTRTDARKNYTQAVEDQETNLATAQENLDKAQKNYDTLGIDDYYTSMASAANSGKTNREIVTDWYTRYAEEIAGYENTLANLNIQLTQAQQDGDTARADGLQGQIADYTSRENIAKGQCSIPELGLQGFDAVSQTYNKIEQYREALEQAQQSYQNSATSASRSVDNAETKLAQSQREDDTLTNLQTALENCTLTATMDGTITALDALGRARRVGAAFLRYRDRNVTGTHAGHRVHDRAGHAVADGLDGNDRRNADDDAQHREQTAHFVASDAGQRHADILKKLHVRRSPFVRPQSGRRAASAPAGIPRPARGCA